MALKVKERDVYCSTLSIVKWKYFGFCLHTISVLIFIIPFFLFELHVLSVVLNAEKQDSTAQRVFIVKWAHH